MNPRQSGTPVPDDFDDLIDRLRTSNDDPKPAAEYRMRLRENLMTTTTLTAPGMRSAPGMKPAGWQWPVNGIRYLAYAATVALVLTIVTAGYLGSRGGSASPTPDQGAVLAPSTASPEASPVIEVNRADFYASRCLEQSGLIAACNATRFVSQASFVGSVLPETITSVEMQDWQVTPGGQVAFSEVSNGGLGIAIDMVTGGGYIAVFSVPVRVDRTSLTGEQSVPEEIAAGTPAVLVQGDAVTYTIGSKRTTDNLIGSVALQFKTVVISDSAVTPESLGATGDFTMTSDGTVAAPAMLKDAGDGWYGLQLTYAVAPVSSDFPNAYELARGLILGPIPPVGSMDVPNFGFMLWISEAKG